MVVHLGVIVVAVALVASTTYTHSSVIDLTVGKTARYGGHSFELIAVEGFTTPRSNGVRAQIRVDDEKNYAPAITTYTAFGMNVPTPSVRNGVLDDIYLTIEPGASPGAKSATIKVFIKPLVVWLWIGGLMMVVGTALSGFPGKRRRRPTDPTSAPVPVGGTPPGDTVPVDSAPIDDADSAEPVSV